MEENEKLLAKLDAAKKHLDNKEFVQAVEKAKKVGGAGRAGEPSVFSGEWELSVLHREWGQDRLGRSQLSWHLSMHRAPPARCAALCGAALCCRAILS